MSDIMRVRLRSSEKPAPMQPIRASVGAVEEAELHVYPARADKNTGLAAIICPGGAYAGLSLYAEGHACAAWLASSGVTGLVLQYRLPGGDPAVPLEDARLALSYAREHCEDWGVNPAGVGLFGFSAGGHLAALACNMTKAGQPRPAFSVLFYPVISLEDSPEGKTTLNLLGAGATALELAEFSADRLVSGDSPPALLLHCDDDPLVPAEQSVLYYQALRKQGVPASLHIFPQGGHGWGFGETNLAGERFRSGRLAREQVQDWLLNRFPS